MNMSSQPGNERKKWFKLDPMLSDGESWTIAGPSEACSMLQRWLDLDEVGAGDSITIHVVEMTDDEVEELPNV